MFGVDQQVSRSVHHHLRGTGSAAQSSSAPAFPRRDPLVRGRRCRSFTALGRRSSGSGTWAVFIPLPVLLRLLHWPCRLFDPPLSGSLRPLERLSGLRPPAVS